MAARRTSRRPAPPAYLILGADSYRRTQARERIIADHVPAEVRDFAVGRFSLERTPLDAVLAQALNRPMLSPVQVLVMTELDGVKEDALARLEEYFSTPADFTVLVFEAEELDRRTRLARLLLDQCELVDAAETQDDGAVLESTRRFAREFNLALDAATAEDLVFAVGPNQGLLRAELEKLRAFAGEKGRVTSADLENLVSPARRFSVFDLVGLLAERRRDEALRRLRKLLHDGESPVGIVGLLAWAYRQLLLARALPPNTPTWRAARVVRAPASRIAMLLRQAKQFSLEELRQAFAALLEADVALKSSSASPEAILEALVIELSGSEKARSHA